MKAMLTVDMSNAAFEDDPTAELARILRALADRLEGASVDESFPVRDTNGNKVGQLRFDDSGRYAPPAHGRGRG